MKGGLTMEIYLTFGDLMQFGLFLCTFTTLIFLTIDFFGKKK